MSQFDEDRETYWLAEIAAWRQAYIKAQLDYRERNRHIVAAILRQREQRRRRPWYRRLWQALKKGTLP